MKANRRQKNQTGIVFRLVIVACVAFVFFKLVQIQMQLNDKQAQIDTLAQQKAVAEIYNEDLQNKVDTIDCNPEQLLRENGYVGPSDQVYQITN